MHKLQFQDRWAVTEPIGRKGGLLVAWNQEIEVKQLWSNDFCMELRVIYEQEESETWVIFVHASTDTKERQQQWEFLNNRKHRWGTKWVMGGILMT